MKFTATAAALVLASSAIASPLAAKARAAGHPLRKTGLNRPVVGIGPEISNGTGTDAASPSSNWAGAALVTTGVTAAVGTFTIPQPTKPSGGSSSTQYCGAAWVGIDGDTCQTGLIQSGVFWCVEDGEYSYEAWYEYIPAASISYSDLTVTAGDVITVTITKTGAHSGHTTLENVSTGESGTHHFDDVTSGTLCGENAEWIVEDFESGSSLVPFADFGTVVFTDSYATVGGATVSPGGGDATNIYLESSSDKALTETTISGETVTVEYI